MSEVIEGTAGVEIAVYEGALLQPAAPLPDIAARFGQYRELCAMLLTDDDYQPVGGKQFLKRAGWRKLATAMGVTLERVTKEIDRDPDGRVQWAEFEVRATAPNGRFADGWGGCSRWERTFSKPDHDIPATAETRAFSRACADLFGLGALSAEEVDEGGQPDNGRLRGSGRTAPAPSSPPTTAALNTMHRRVRAVVREGINVGGENLTEDQFRRMVIEKATGDRKTSTTELVASEMAAVFDELTAAERAVGIAG